MISESLLREMLEDYLDENEHIDFNVDHLARFLVRQHLKHLLANQDTTDGHLLVAACSVLDEQFGEVAHGPGWVSLRTQIIDAAKGYL